MPKGNDMEFEDKEQILRALHEEMKADLSLPLRESNLVFGEGSVKSTLMFIGEAPGFYEDKLGRPFVGRAGKLLDRLLEMAGWKREDVYISNIVKRRPPGNRDPFPEEIDAYKSYLAREITIINPKVIVPLGRFSMNYFLPHAKISKDHGKVFRLKGVRLILPLYHPAAALRSASVLAELERDFIKLKAVVEKADELLTAEGKDMEKAGKEKQQGTLL